MAMLIHSKSSRGVSVTHLRWHVTEAGSEKQLAIGFADYSAALHWAKRVTNRAGGRLWIRFPDETVHSSIGGFSGGGQAQVEVKKMRKANRTPDPIHSSRDRTNEVRRKRGEVCNHSDDGLHTWRYDGQLMRCLDCRTIGYRQAGGNWLRILERKCGRCKSPAKQRHCTPGGWIMALCDECKELYENKRRCGSAT